MQLIDQINNFKNSFLTHTHKKQKDGLKTRAALLMFLLKLEIFKVAAKKCIKTTENSCCFEFGFP